MKKNHSLILDKEFLDYCQLNEIEDIEDAYSVQFRLVTDSIVPLDFEMLSYSLVFMAKEIV